MVAATFSEVTLHNNYIERIIASVIIYLDKFSSVSVAKAILYNIINMLIFLTSLKYILY